MAGSRRERDYARRRHEAWQRRRAGRLAHRRQRQRTAVAAVAALLVLSLVAVAVWVGARSHGSASAAGTSASPTSTATSSARDCPAPTSTATTKAPFQLSAAPAASVAQDRTWTGSITTSCGRIGITLDGAKAPKAVASFVTLAGRGFFTRTRCHRLTTSGIFVLQCGDPTGTGEGGPGYTFGPVENAPADGVYPAGTIAMARGTSTSSQGSQFFIVYRASTIPGGYTVFGHVTSGLSVVDRVAAAGSDDSGGTGDGAPNTPISIEQVSVK